jgi:hypothetical protein
MEREKAQTNIKAKAIADKIEHILQTTILAELKREFGPEESRWWIEGIPKKIRTKVGERCEEDDYKRGGKEYYFDLIDYRDIISSHWNLFSKLFGYGKANISKEKRTSWINDVNDIRKIVAHSSSGRTVPMEQLAKLEEYEKWLNNQINEVDENEGIPPDEDN